MEETIHPTQYSNFVEEKLINEEIKKEQWKSIDQLMLNKMAEMLDAQKEENINEI